MERWPENIAGGFVLDAKKVFVGVKSELGQDDSKTKMVVAVFSKEDNDMPVVPSKPIAPRLRLPPSPTPSTLGT